jgi:hypothetical protein
LEVGETIRDTFECITIVKQWCINNSL